MFDFVFTLTLDLISILAWYLPVLILFGFIGGFFKGV